MYYALWRFHVVVFLLFILGSTWKFLCLSRLVFSRFFDIRGNLGNVKEKKGFSLFLPFTGLRKPTVLVYCLTNTIIYFPESNLSVSNSFIRISFDSYAISLREKSVQIRSFFFLVGIFLHSDWIRRDTPHLSVFSPSAGKYGPEKTPYLNTFHVVVGTMQWRVEIAIFNAGCKVRFPTTTSQRTNCALLFLYFI